MFFISTVISLYNIGNPNVLSFFIFFLCSISSVKKLSRLWKCGIMNRFITQMIMTVFIRVTVRLSLFSCYTIQLTEIIMKLWILNNEVVNVLCYRSTLFSIVYLDWFTMCLTFLLYNSGFQGPVFYRRSCLWIFF